jgi:AraC-like DNA-binding protein
MPIPSCRFVHAGRVHGRRTTRFQSHAHDCHELAIPLRGLLHARIGGRSADAEPGSVLWYPAGEEHFEAVGAKVDGDWLYLQIQSDEGSEWPLLLSDPSGSVRLLTGLIVGESDHSLAAIAKRDALCYAVMAELRLTLERQAIDHDPLINLARQFIKRHLAEPLPIERIAAACGLSRAHFARRWRQLTGVTVQTHVRDRRLDAAHDLLLNTDLLLSTIAQRVGFGSGQLLSRLLSRHRGSGARLLRRARRPIAYT